MLRSSRAIKEYTCPYRSMGCTFEEETKDKVTSHVNKEGLSHATLLVEYLTKRDQEITHNAGSNHLEITVIESTLNIENEKINKEIDKLKEEDRKKEIRIQALCSNIELIKRNERDQREALYSAINDLRNENNDLKKKTNLKNSNTSFKKSFDNKNYEERLDLNRASSVVEDVAELKIRVKDGKEELKDIRKDITIHETQINHVRQKMSKTSKLLEDLTEQSRKIKDDIETLKKESKKYQENTKTSFINLKEETTNREETMKKNMKNTNPIRRQTYETTTKNLNQLVERRSNTWNSIFYEENTNL